MKTKEELNALKEEVETVNKKLRALSADELEQGVGGFAKEWYPYTCCPVCGNRPLQWHNIVYDKEYGKYCGTAYCNRCEWDWRGPLLF